jgi:hypothetical protein
MPFWIGLAPTGWIMMMRVALAPIATAFQSFDGHLMLDGLELFRPLVSKN